MRSGIPLPYLVCTQQFEIAQEKETRLEVRKRGRERERESESKRIRNTSKDNPFVLKSRSQFSFSLIIFTSTERVTMTILWFVSISMKYLFDARTHSKRVPATHSIFHSIGIFFFPVNEQQQQQNQYSIKWINNPIIVSTK